MQLRPATVQDCETLSALHMECFPRGWGTSEFASFFERDGIIATLAEQGAAAVGFIFCWIVGEECELLALAVAPEYRRQAIAKTLLTNTLDTLEKADVKKLHLEVNVNNLAAQQLYLAQGFTITARRKDYYRQTDGTCADAVTMVRRFD